MADRPVYLYLEHDGRVFLIERDGRLSFPFASDEPFAYELRVEIDLPDAKVLFGTPKLAAHPREWVAKDAVPGMTNVDPVVQRAINASLVREVTGALVFDAEGRILMVKATRGFTKGMWNMPGGFLLYGESPEEGVQREVREETGIEVDVGRLVGVYTRRFASPYFMRAFVYECRPRGTTLVLDPDEIAEARWMTPDEARDATLNTFLRTALEERLTKK
ncbi:MAG: NUDIX hydrolase [Thermoplasmatota archaeon]